MEKLGPVARDAVPVLVDQLKRLESVAPNSVLVTLGKIGPDAAKAVPDLIELVNRNDKFHAKDAVDALGLIGSSAADATPVIAKRLGEKSKYDRIAAARALGRIGPLAKASVPELKTLLGDEQHDVRAWAAFAIARITSDVKPQVATLVDLLESHFNESRQFGGSVSHEICETLELLGPAARDASKVLLTQLTNEKERPNVRGSAARALLAVAPDDESLIQPIVAFIERLGSGFERSMVVVRTVNSLAHVGPKAKSAIATLRKLLDDDDDRIAAAAEALERIEGK